MARGIPDWSVPYADWGGEFRSASGTKTVDPAATETLVTISGRGQLLAVNIYGEGGSHSTGYAADVEVDGQSLSGLTFAELAAFGAFSYGTLPLFLTLYDSIDALYNLSGFSKLTYRDSVVLKASAIGAALPIDIEWWVFYELMVA